MTKKYSDYAGIDYGFGRTNIDHETGFRFGVISQQLVLQAWADSSEPEYPCGECDAWDGDNDCCGDDFYDCEPIAHNYNAEGYKATCSQDGDIFVIQSPYFTYAQLCSPCAPGACYLATPIDHIDHESRRVLVDNKCYCFGPDWFDNDYEPCPYPVWEVATGKLVYEPSSNQLDKGDK